MSTPNPKVNFYFDKSGQWQEAFKALRPIALGCDLTEQLKWGHPCYSLDKANVFLMHGFNDYCALLFMKGALMDDPESILVQQTENVQSARQIRFTSADQIKTTAATLKLYIQNAIEVEKAGLKVVMKTTADFTMPDEFRSRLDDDDALAAAFRALTPGRQKGYLLHFSSAKQAQTREARIEKSIPMIMAGKGRDD